MFETAIENMRLMVTATFAGLAIYQLMTFFESPWDESRKEQVPVRKRSIATLPKLQNRR